MWKLSIDGVEMESRHDMSNLTLLDHSSRSKRIIRTHHTFHSWKHNVIHNSHIMSMSLSIMIDKHFIVHSPCIGYLVHKVLLVICTFGMCWGWIRRKLLFYAKTQRLHVRSPCESEAIGWSLWKMMRKWKFGKDMSKFTSHAQASCGVPLF